VTLSKILPCLVAALCSGAVLAPAAPAAPPANDNYLASFSMRSPGGELATGYQDAQDTTEATLQADLFNPDREGQPLAGGGPEPAQCGQSTYGKTVWYDFAPPYPGGAQIRGSGFPTAIAVYEYDVRMATIVRQITCQVSSGAAINEVLALVRPRRGHAFTVQVGGVVAGGAPASGRLDFTFHYFRDSDGDGVLDAEPDTCRGLRGIPPSGCPPRIPALARYNFRPAGGGVRLTRLLVSRAPAGSRVEARCRRCGIRQVVQVRREGRSVRLTRLLGRTLPAGSRLEIWVTHARVPGGDFRFGAIGGYVRFTVRGSALGDRVERCLMPGSMKPRRRCQ
jgi:hypothetical protein